MTTGQRVERLEREVRWMRRMGALAVAVAAAVFLVGQGKDKELPDLEVRSLKVVDKEGRRRASLITVDDHGAPVLSFRDRHGRTRVMLALMPDGSPDLSFQDRHGKRRAALSTTPDGSPELSFRDKDGKQRAALTTFREGSSRLTFFDGAEKPRAELVALSSQGPSSLTLYDPKGDVIWKAPED